jgi:hypothetical protein
MRHSTWLLARILVTLGFGFLLSACALIRDQLDPTTVSIRGVPPTLEQLNVNATANANNLFVDNLVQVAGLPQNAALGPRTADWDLVMRAGIYEIGRQCDQYLDVLFRFNREQRAGRQDLAAAAGATGAIMGIAGASAKALAITAASFGLASSLFDASVNSVLFTIEPSALRYVALQGRQQYLESLRKNNVEINSRPDMLIALQGYLTQCSPAAIEANINNAASGAPSVVTFTPGVTPAALLAAPATALIVPSPKNLLPSEPVKPKEPVRSRPFVPPPDVTLNYRQFLDPSVKIDASQAKKIFAALCVLPTEVDGAGAPSTTARIKAFQQWQNFRPGQPMPSATGQLTSREIDILLGQPDCQRSHFENIYEVNFRRGVGTGPPRDINSPNLINAMNEIIKKIDPQKQLAPNASVPDMRSRIPDVRKGLENQLVLKDDALSNQLTKDLVNVLLGGS